MDGTRATAMQRYLSVLLSLLLSPISAVAQKHVSPLSLEPVPHALGEKRLAVLVADFPGVPVTPSVSVLKEMFFSGSSGTFNSYLREVSYGKSWVTGEIYGPVQLDRSYAWEHNEKNAAAAAAVKLAGAALDLKKYDVLIFIMPLPGAQWGGNAGLGYCDGDCIPMVVLGAATAPVDHSVFYTTSLHEYLHFLGMGHANSLDYGPDAVGIAEPRYEEVGMTVDSQTTEAAGGGLLMDSGDPTSSPMGGMCSNIMKAHLAAPYKYHMGWLDKGPNLQEVESSGTFHLRPLETATSGLQAIRVRRIPGSDLWLWFDYRQAVGIDQDFNLCNPHYFTGAAGHYEIPYQTDSTVPACPLGGRLCGLVGLVDFTPDSQADSKYDFFDATLSAGKSWTDPYGPLTISVAKATAEGVDVTVNYDAACATVNPSSRDHGVASDTGTIQVTAAATCAWTAAPYRTSEWISVSAGQSGKGAGTVTYTVSKNDSGHARKGWIIVNRQAFAITQPFEEVAPAGGRVLPNLARYQVESEQETEFYFVDRNGGQDLKLAYILVNDQADIRNACYIEYSRDTNTFRLGDDAGTGWAGPHHPDHPGNPNPENGQCSMRVGAPPEVGGDELYLGLHLLIKNGLLGNKYVYLRAIDAEGLDSGWQKAGAWTIFINEPPVPASATPSSGSGSGQTFQIVFRDPNGFADITTASVVFNGPDSNRCLVMLNASTSAFYLASDGGGWLRPATAGSPVMLQNKSCALNAAEASVSGSGTDLTVTLPLVFNPAFAGSKTLSGQVQDSTGVTSSWTKVGSWTVPASYCTLGLDPPRIETGPNEARGTVSIRADAGCGWIPSSAASWLEITSGRAGAGAGSFGFRVLTNPAASPRTTTISIGAQTLDVLQSARSVALGAPSVTSILHGATLQPISAVTAGAWITIKGTELAPVTRTWAPADFDGNKLPTQLDGVSVTVNGKPAYVWYISSTQLNVLTPDDDGSSTVRIRVTTPAGQEPLDHTLTRATMAPGFFMLDPEDRKYVAARHLDYSLLGKPGLYSGADTTPAKPGETILLYGTGFGPTNPSRPAAEMVAVPAPLAKTVTIRIAGRLADVSYAGLVSSGLYQFNVRVPPDTPDGDQSVQADIAGVQSQAGANVTIKK
jgi:uncharacterized protein (TIGR03437 family)